MEGFMEAKALKPSLRRELAVKSSQQVFFDDFLSVVPTEDFSVDELFDFSNVEGQVEVAEEEKDCCVNSSQERVDDDDNFNYSSFFGTGCSVSLPAGELTVPDDYLAELEWVSQYVDDSPSELSLLCPVSKEKTETKSENLEKNLGLPLQAVFPSQVPSKTRSKRPRPGTRVWPIGSPLSESPSSSSSSSNSTLILAEPVLKPETEPVAKKAKKNPVQGGALQFQRRCTHCGVHKTPQWRTGPLGPKTLCNACGVRFKSGRLFPEYRPACSPTFSSEIHSNSHRKVLEIRKRKEVAGAESGLNHAQMVQSF